MVLSMAMETITLIIVSLEPPLSGHYTRRRVAGNGNAMRQQRPLEHSMSYDIPREENI